MRSCGAIRTGTHRLNHKELFANRSQKNFFFKKEKKSENREKKKRQKTPNVLFRCRLVFAEGKSESHIERQELFLWSVFSNFTEGA